MRVSARISEVELGQQYDKRDQRRLRLHTSQSFGNCDQQQPTEDSQAQQYDTNSRPARTAADHE